MTIELFKCRKFGMKLEIFVQRHPHLILSRWTISIISFGSDIELRKFIVSVVLSFLMLALIFYAFFYLWTVAVYFVCVAIHGKPEMSKKNTETTTTTTAAPTTNRKILLTLRIWIQYTSEIRRQCHKWWHRLLCSCGDISLIL